MHSSALALLQLNAAKAISAASPSITPQYARDNAARLDELDQAICDLVA